MAIEIHTSPEIWGESAEIFEREMANHVPRKPMSAERKAQIAAAEERGRRLYEKLKRQHAARL